MLCHHYFGPQRGSSVYVAAAMLCLLVGVSSAIAQEGNAFRQAAEQFEPVSEAELADARETLRQSMDRLERFVQPRTRNGARWLEYLRWDALTEALAADPPELAAMNQTLRRLHRDETGLERSQFRRLASDLRRYMNLYLITRQADQSQYYRQQVEALERQLDEYRDEPNPRLETQIGARLAFLDVVGSSPALVREVRREFAQPNVYVDVATSLVAAGTEPIDRREPVTDCILGTSVRADTHTRGRVGVRSLPSEQGAILEFVSSGQTASQNFGRNGPAVIRSSGCTDFTATKRVVLTDREFSTRPARAAARTDTHLQSVAKSGGGLGSRIVSNIGWKRARQNEGRAEAIAADHAEDRIERRVDQEVDEEIRDARESYEKQYRRPLERRGELPEYIRFRSDEDSLGFVATQATRGQLGATSAPPAPPRTSDMTVQVHATAINNYLAGILSGATLRESDPDDGAKLDAPVPEWLKEVYESRREDDEPIAPEDFTPWSLRFQEGRPVSVDFAEGNVRLTLHIARLVSGDKEPFDNWDVTATYVPELSHGRLVLRREGDLTMLPANFRGELTNRQVGERANLEKELTQRSDEGRGIPLTIELDPLEPEGALANAGPLDFTEFVASGGWVTAAWNRQVRVGPRITYRAR